MEMRLAGDHYADSIAEGEWRGVGEGLLLQT